MKKLFTTSLVLCTVTILLLSTGSGCKKETVTISKTDTLFKCNASIKGLWEGTYLTNQVTHQPTYSSFTFYPDGSMLLKNYGVAPSQLVIFMKGRWALTNNILAFTDTTINYSSTVIQKSTFTYDSTLNTLSNGIWQNVTSDNGNFYTGTYPTMLKIN